MFRVQCHPSAPEAPTLLLKDVLKQAGRTRWADCRNAGKGLAGQARMGIESLASIRGVPFESLMVREVTSDDVQAAVTAWRAEGLSSATITKRLNCLSVLGVDVTGKRPRKDRALKWWLRPDQEEKAIAWIDERLSSDEEPGLGVSAEALRTLKFVIRWTTKTGTRIEETLRFTDQDFGADFSEMTVPGLKTQTSQATLPLGSAARSILKEWMETERPLPGLPIISIGYYGLYAAWVLLKVAMGWPDNATLKALRRSAARYLHAEMGMPLDMTRHYLRHEIIATTMEYLRLTGGYGTDEMGRFLK